MKFVFWQNMVSIHQSAFIKALSEMHDVTLVAEEDVPEQRRRDGWGMPDMGCAKVFVSPSSSHIDMLLSAENTYQVFSGIDAYPMVYDAFKKAIARNCDVSVMMEPYQWQGLKGFFRRCKYALHALRFGKKIKRVFATGDLGVNAFRKAGFPAEKLFQWGYFTEQVEETPVVVNSKPKVIFVGSIDSRKNILTLIEAAVKCQELFGEFLIVGGGPLEGELKRVISPYEKIHYLGRIDNKDVGRLIASCDLLVLPSLFDGWGDVVNEALSQGTRVLCPDRCGASSLLDGMDRGGVFSISNPVSLDTQLRHWLEQGPLSIDQRQSVADWANSHISGSCATEYFLDCVSMQYADIPWNIPSSSPSLLTNCYRTLPSEREDTKPDLIFVGRLDDNKNVCSILKHFDRIQSLVGQFTIVGDGNLRREVGRLAEEYSNIVITGSLDNRTTNILISAHDYLVLPSRYDGWGAVVNEALAVGTRVICSDSCGAEVLLDGKTRGEALPGNLLVNGLVKWLSKGGLPMQSRDQIKHWAMENISGHMAAEYFVESIKNGSCHKLLI